MVLALFLIILFVNIYQEAITGFLVVQGRFTIESFIYSNYTEQSDIYIGRGQAVNLSSFWIVNNSMLDYAWLATNETGSWVNHSIYLSPLKMNGIYDWSNFTWQNSSILNTFSWKIYANTTNYVENVTSEGLIIIIYGLNLPEGIYYMQPTPLPVAGNYQYGFRILFQGETADAGDIYGCYVNQSNCYDDLLPGCKQIFVNTTLTSSVVGDISVDYILTDSDVINSTLGGATDNWIPWRIDRCGHYDSGMNVIQENTSIPWRIHVHPIEWTTGDIANAVNSKIAPNMFMQNTVKGDNQGDIAYSVAKYGGSNVELDCRDGVDDTSDSDNLIDCDDPDCFGITHSCLPKQSFADETIYYSPSGSHGTLAPDIPAGDIGSNTSTFSAGFGETSIQYTMHQMPDGNLKMRFRHWNLGKTATIFVSGFPNITSANKYFPGSGETKGEMVYFLDKDGNPIDSDWLDSSQTYSDKIALRSYLSGGTEITNLDTIVNVSFDQNAIDMSQGYVLRVNLNYLEGTIVYENIVYVTIYFDNTTYPGGKWNSTNEREDEIVIDGLSWTPCGDTKNGDFDLLGCSGDESICFDQKSYDCYDLDCDMKQGPTAWNDYTRTNTVGLCAYTSESQISSMCFDGYNNDWRTEDPTWGHVNTGLSLIDCRDSDCDTVTDGINQCEYNIELNCTDSFNNDMYQKQDCDIQTGGTINDVEYDCSSYCRSVYYYEEKGSQCDDNIDNDWDKYYTTTGGVSGYVLNSTYGAGMDCAWGTAADEDCDLEILSSGHRCELKHELTCDDEFDNDYDSSTSEPNPGWTSSAYSSWFGMSLVSSADFDDYDCQNEPEVMKNESYDSSWCFDGIDNDMDAYYRVGDNFVVNTSTGKDRNDPDCLGVVNPDNSSEICLAYEYNATDPFFINLPEIDYYCKNSIDDDGDGPKDCYDSDCSQQFTFCYACSDNEMTSWDACADRFDNDYDGLTDGDDSDCLYQLATYDGQFYIPFENNSMLCSDGFDSDQNGLTDCEDPDCFGIGICGLEICNDYVDNDGDGLTDCEDSSDCDSDSHCITDAEMTGIYRPPASSSATFGEVSVQWTSRVRDNDNFTITIAKTTNYADAYIYLGRLTGDAIPVGYGLIGSLFSVSGPDADKFETRGYGEDTTHTKGQIEIADQVPSGGFNLGGFSITIDIPTNGTTTDSFEYYHAIDGSASVNNDVPFVVIENTPPIINSVFISPDNGEIIYDSSVWIGINATDVNGTINKCFYNLTGPSFSSNGDDRNECEFDISGLKRDGLYTLEVWAEDDAGNLADRNITTYTIDIIPEYIDDSFVLYDRWYSGLDTILLNAQFYTDDATSISSCSVFYETSSGILTSAGTINANNTGDRLLCSGYLSAPIVDEMYQAWVVITDGEGDVAYSDKETFYVANSVYSSSTGVNGEIWDAKFSDIANDGIIDYCKISTNHPPEISLISPEAGEIGVSTETELRAIVTDQDNDFLNVYFYDGDNRTIGSNIGLANGSTASYIWSGRDPLTAYSWYAIVTDGINSTNSELRRFITAEAISEPVAVTKAASGIVEEMKKSFTVSPGELNPVLNQSASSTEIVSVVNNGDVPLDIEIQIDPRIQKFVTVKETSVDLRSGQSKSIQIRISVPDDTEPGIYVGSIIFYSEGIEQIVRFTMIITEYPELVIIKRTRREMVIEYVTRYMIPIAVLIAIIVLFIIFGGIIAQILHLKNTKHKKHQQKRRRK